MPGYREGRVREVVERLMRGELEFRAASRAIEEIWREEKDALRRG